MTTVDMYGRPLAVGTSIRKVAASCDACRGQLDVIAEIVPTPEFEELSGQPAQLLGLMLFLRQHGRDAVLIVTETGCTIANKQVIRIDDSDGAGDESWTDLLHRINSPQPEKVT